jgi:hypothetical protein
MMVSKNWFKLDIDSDNLDSYTDKHDDWNLVFAHHKEEDEIYPLTLIEIADAQRKDPELKVYYKKNAQMPQKDICFHLIKDTKVLCKNGKIIIPASLRHRTVNWYHHYLQHPGHLRLEEMMRSMMYWKGMRTTIRHPEIHQNLQILPSQQETQPKVWTSTTKAGHNDSLERVMCRPYRSLHLHS